VGVKTTNSTLFLPQKDGIVIRQARFDLIGSKLRGNVLARFDLIGSKLRGNILARFDPIGSKLRDHLPRAF
jgi:hypothetical protein